MGNRTLGIIPARAGSKGVSNKNIRPLNGRPLIAYTISAAVGAGLSRLILSTDSEQIAAVGRPLGAEVPFLRPAELANDTAKSAAVVTHLLETLRTNEGAEYDTVVLLQPTSPMRTTQDILAALELYHHNAPCSVVSLSKVDEPHPYKMKTIRDGLVHPFVEGTDSSVPRQQLPEVFTPNGALYIVGADHILRTGSFFHERTIPYVMPAERSVNINSITDMYLAEYMMTHGAEL